MLSDNEDIYCHNFGMIKKNKKDFNFVIIIEIFHITGIVSA